MPSTRTKGRSHEVVIFASTWEELPRPLEPGDLIGLKAKKDPKKGSLLADVVTIRAT